jgi:hypothetical protein
MGTKNKFYFYIDYRKETEVTEICKKYKFSYDYDPLWFSCNTEIYTIDTEKKYVWGDTVYNYNTSIAIDNLNLLENVFIVLSNLIEFEYSKTTFQRDEKDYSYFKNSTTKELIPRILFKDKYLIIIKNLITLEEYLITENRIINCIEYLTQNK